MDEITVVVCEPDQQPEARSLKIAEGPRDEVVPAAIRDVLGGSYRVIGFPIETQHFFFVFIPANREGKPNRWGLHGPMVIASASPARDSLTESEVALVIEDLDALGPDYMHPLAFLDEHLRSAFAADPS